MPRMATLKVFRTMTEELVVEAETRPAALTPSDFLDAALVRPRQFDRLSDLERDLEREFGPIPNIARESMDAMEWPK